MSIRNLKKIAVVDIESSCWQHNEQAPKGEVSEIIEIGLAIVNLQSLTIKHTESIMVKPTRSKISKFCTELTTLNQEQVDQGISFKDACKYLQDEFDSKNLAWSSWGQYDRKMFESQCRETYVDYPFSREHINIKNVFAVMNGLPKELNMPAALDYLNKPLKGTLHRGIDDAINIADIFIDMMKKVRGVKVAKLFVIYYLGVYDEFIKFTINRPRASN